MTLKNKLKRLRNAFYTTLFQINKKGLKLHLGQNVLIRGCSVHRNGGGQFSVC